MTKKSTGDRGTVDAVLETVRGPGDDNPVTPVRLKAEDEFRFSFHRGVRCWNKCCHGADVTLTPADILRLCKRLGVGPSAFLEAYTVPTLHERADLPVAKLKMGGGDGTGPCPFLSPEGCTVYADRPVTCRYYPTGLASVKLKDAEDQSDFYFLVKEAYCRGHDEEKHQSVAEFRREQGVEDYDRVNRGWIDILMKMASWKTLGGPRGKELSTQVRQMFFMVSTDVEAFRRFVFETKFLDTYEIEPAVVEAVRTDDEALLALGFAWMKNVMFNDPALTMKPSVVQKAVAKAREDMGAM